MLLLAIHQDWIVAAFAILFLRSAAAKFFGPAEMGLMQGTLSSEQYVRAAGMNQMVMGMFMLFGMGLGAASYRYFGIEGAIIIDGVSFVISGILVLSCRFALEIRLPNGKARLKDIGVRSIFSDFREGFRYIRNHRLLLAILSGYFMFGIIDGVFAILPVFTMKYKLSPQEYETYSPLVMVFLGIGFMIGSALSSAMIKRFSATAVLIAGMFSSGILIVLFSGITSVWLYLILILIVGILVSPINVVLGGWIPELVEPSKMGRVVAWFEPVIMLAQSLTLGLIAIAFPSFVSIGALYIVAGLCLLTASVYYRLVLPRLFRDHHPSAAPSSRSTVEFGA
ncbi:MFS transporter [Cohnella kolymensis]|uniref:MFS transporter n=1 Tax=Cohnella kolymensis TaxID=1590652 RepID=UPI00069817A2|nr:MFS transporter [Cohnella kolymensis]